MCKYSGTTGGNLKIHILSTHEGGGYPCTQCDYPGTHGGSLKMQIQSMHQYRISMYSVDTLQP